MHVKMLPSGEADKIDEVYSNDGKEISTSSSLVVYKNTIWIGTSQRDAYYCRPETTN